MDYSAIKDGLYRSASTITSRMVRVFDSHRIVFYHRTCNPAVSYFYAGGFSADVFRNQVRHYADHYELITVEEAIRRSDAGVSLKNTLSITFDDGFRDIWDTFLPILDEHGICTTIYLIEDCIDNSSLMWKNKLIHVKNSAERSVLERCSSAFYEQFGIRFEAETLLSDCRGWPLARSEEMAQFVWDNCVDTTVMQFLEEHSPYLASGQISELLSMGHEIGCHSKTHPYSELMTTTEQVHEEYVAPAQRLSERFKCAILSASCPFGSLPSSELIDYIFTHSNYQSLLSIRDTLRNTGAPKRWGRVEMEMDYASSMHNLYTRPLLRHYLKTA